jgi:hypothetical protein
MTRLNEPHPCPGCKLIIDPMVELCPECMIIRNKHREFPKKRKLRVQFSKSRSSSYKAAVIHCKNYSTYREWTTDGVIMHSVEVETLEEWSIIQRFVGGWNSTSHYLNGKPALCWDIWALWEMEREQLNKLRKMAEAKVIADFAPKKIVKNPGGKNFRHN